MEKASVGNGAEHRKHVDISTAGWGGGGGGGGEQQRQPPASQTQA